MIQPLKRPPEPAGTIEEQLEDIRTYLNILYRKVMTSGDEAVAMARAVLQSITEGNNPELANIYAATLRAKKIIVSDDLTDGQTVISGDNIQTGTISADRIDVDDLIVDNALVVKGNLVDGQTTISGANIKTGQIQANYLNIDGITAQNVDISGTLKAVQGAIGLLQVINNGLAFASPNYGGSFRLSIANPDTIPEINFFVGRSDQGAYMEITTNQGIPEGKLNEMQIKRASDAYNYHTLEDIIDDIDSRLAAGGL